MFNVSWPMHPQPLPDEIFSSWMARAAVCNGEGLSRFIKLTIPELRAIDKSIDNFLSETMIKRVSTKMNTSFRCVHQTTLDSYVGFVCETDTNRCHRKYNILNSGETSALRYFQQFCPICLKEGKAYFRKTWRLSFVTVCCVHNCLLEDRCSKCGSPVLVMSNKHQDKRRTYLGSISTCHKCLHDLSDIDRRPALESVINDTKLYLKVLNRGFYELENERWIYSFSFFLVLRHFIQIYASKAYSQCPQRKVVDTDTLTNDMRYDAMSDMAGIFNDWPSNFVEYCTKRDISYSLITPIIKANSGKVPFWLDEQIKPYTYARHQEPTISSVICAVVVVN